MTFRILFSFLVLFLLISPVPAQQPCQAPALTTAVRQHNIFSEQQENDLGDAMAEHIQREFRVIEDEEVTARLQQLGDRILKYLPPTNLRFRFFLTDLPYANAFAVPGGRIYVTRKLVAFTQNEDELAAVMAHEIGHVLARQGSVRMTELLRKVLGVTQVGDRADIFHRYHGLLENASRKPGAFSGEDREGDQMVADQVAFFALARAGYTPEAIVSFWDRFTETKGKTGNWFTDFWGVTKPEQRRLREMLRLLPKIPESCIERGTATLAGDYAKWRETVVSYSGLGHRESLRGVLWKRTLEPPLRAEVLHLRFSPDGKHILAQDDSSIFILSQDPFEVRFRIDSQEAHPAQFTPDSKAVVFYNSGLRVEKWSLEEQKQMAVHEVVRTKGCLQTALSPDGRTLVCWDPDFHLNLVDVESGLTTFQKKSFCAPQGLELFVFAILRLLADDEIEYLRMSFTPDGHYFVAARSGTAFAYDLNTKVVPNLPGSVKDLLSDRFAFVGPDRLVGVDGTKGEKSAMVRFPSGEIISKVTLGRQRIESATGGEYLMLRPIKDYPVGVMNLETKKIFMASKRSAMDIFEPYYVSERITGEVTLFKIADGSRLKSLQLPRSPLGRLRAAALSTDMNWIAISERTRGAVWNVSTGERVFSVRGFRGANFAERGLLYADFPKYEETERSLAVLDPSSKNVDVSKELGEARVSQYGRYLLSRKPAKKGGGVSENMILEVTDVHTGKPLWTKTFPKEAPDIHPSISEDAFVFAWSTSADATKAAAKEDAGLKARIAALKEKEGDSFLLVVDAKTGETRGTLAVETGKGSFRISDVLVAGDIVAVADTSNRVIAYSLSTNEQKGRVFGRNSVLSRAAGVLLVENEPGKVHFYDLATLEKRGELRFAEEVSFSTFSSDGKKLFVLTRNQTAYLLDLAGALKTDAVVARNP